MTGFFNSSPCELANLCAGPKDFSSSVLFFGSTIFALTSLTRYLDTIAVARPCLECHCENVTSVVNKKDDLTLYKVCGNYAQVTSFVRILCIAQPWLVQGYRKDVMVAMCFRKGHLQSEMTYRFAGRTEVTPLFVGSLITAVKEATVKNESL